MNATVVDVAVGDLVWQQMYSPTHPRWDSTLEERIEGGVLYGERRLMRVAGVYPHHPEPTVDGRDVTRWWLVDAERPRDSSLMSYVESDWCVLERVVEDGALF